jgi:hypothetical protein
VPVLDQSSSSAALSAHWSCRESGAEVAEVDGLRSACPRPAPRDAGLTVGGLAEGAAPDFHAALRSFAKASRQRVCEDRRFSTATTRVATVAVAR